MQAADVAMSLGATCCPASHYEAEAELTKGAAAVQAVCSEYRINSADLRMRDA